MTNQTERARPAGAEPVIMALAALQHGVVTRAQLRRAGLADHVVDHRLKTGRLRPIHRGVYLAGPLATSRTKKMAAVMACGEGAVVSHRSAASLWDLPCGDGTSHEGAVAVILPCGDHGRRPGIRAHRFRGLKPDEVTQLERIPVTRVARTLLDIAGGTARRDLERALAEALNRGLTNVVELEAMLARHARRAGATMLRSLLNRRGQPALTRSEAEERFLALVRRAQLPVPEVNVVVGGFEVDFYWRVQRIVTEIDGFAFHSSPDRFESDRRRDAALAASGVRVTRVTWRQLEQEPEAVVVRLEQALVRAAPP
jgi:very-short-patch-repair endonuclease